MIYPLIAVIAIMAIVIVLLAVKLNNIHRSLDEISSGLCEQVHEDTNGVISISSLDKPVNDLVMVINSELHELRQEQLRLQNCDIELQKAVTNVAHDLRTPLTAINGYVELLEEEELTDNGRRYVGIIGERTESLKVMMDELFQYSIVSSTSDELYFEKVSINDQLGIAMAAGYASFRELGITPEIDFTEKVIYREVDKKALQRIFGNIISNAARYSDGDFRVSLNGEGLICFSNTAESLTAIEAGKLFDRFYTVENAKGSTGLGLSIAKYLTEKMHGKIWAEYISGRLFIYLEFN